MESSSAESATGKAAGAEPTTVERPAAKAGASETAAGEPVQASGPRSRMKRSYWRTYSAVKAMAISAITHIVRSGSPIVIVGTKVMVHTRSAVSVATIEEGCLTHGPG